MDIKPAQNIQDTFLNTVRKDKSPITIYLDKYSVLLENNAQEQLIFKHAISTVVSGRPAHTEARPDLRSATAGSASVGSSESSAAATAATAR